MKHRLQWILGLLPALAGALADAAMVTNTAPAAWVCNVPSNSAYTAYLDVPPDSLTSTSFVFNSAWRGAISGALYGATAPDRLIFTAAVARLPGEPIEGSLAANGLDRPYSWRFNAAAPKGSGSFDTNVNSTVTNSRGALLFRSIVVGDVNGDNKLDIVVPSWGDSNLVVFANSGIGTFSPAMFPVSTSCYYDVALADINMDGFQDMVMACAATMITTATNNQSGGFAWFRNTAIGGATGFLRRVSAGDLNGDGAPDAVAITEESGQIIALTNHLAGRLEVASIAESGVTLYGLDVGDMNGDGALDAVVVGPAGYVAVVTNDGRGVLSMATNLSVSSVTLKACKVADFNRDRLADVAVGGGEGYLAIGYGSSSGLVFRTIPQSQIATMIDGLAAGDCDTNGYPDIIIDGGAIIAPILSRDGTNFLSNNKMELVNENLRDVALGDFDANGSLDIAVCGFSTGSLYVAWNSPASAPVVLGTNGLQVTSGASATLALGTHFSNVSVFVSVTNVFKIANRGAGTLQIASVTITNASTAVVQVLNMPSSVAPGVTSQFEIVFSPTAQVAYSMAVVITNNSPVASVTAPYRILLRGTGIKKPVTTLELSDTNQVYDGAAHPVTVTVDPAVIVSNKYNGLTRIPTNAGSYTVVATVYDPIYSGCVTGTLLVASQTLNVACDSDVRGYGTTNPPLTLQMSGFVAGEGPANLTVRPTAACPATTNTPVGDYAITASGGAATNYQFNYIDGILTVTQAVLVTKADDKSRPYGATNPPLTISYFGFKNGEDTNVFSVQPVATTAALTNSPAGPYAITVGGGSASNYLFHYSNGTLIVVGMAATVTIANLTQTYDGSPKPVTVTTTPTGQPVIVYYNGSTSVPVDAGVYAVNSWITNYNYNGSNSATLTIQKGDQSVISFLPPGGGYSASEPINLAATGTPSGIPVTFSIGSGPGILDGADRLLFTGTGNVEVVAQKLSNANWNASLPVTNVYWAVETSTVHYVALAGQTSRWPYASWATAASNLQIAVDVAIAGDTVAVGPGWYGVGGRTAGGGLITNRVVVEKTVFVMSSAGPSSTYVAGGAGTGADAPLGPDAVRCAYLANGARLSGFTLTNGCTGGPLDGGDADKSGGGALAGSDCVISNCILAGNNAVFGGGIYGGVISRGVLRGNQAWTEGGGCSEAVANDSLIYANGADYGGGAFRSTLINCTLADNAAAVGGGAYEGSVDNVIAWYNTADDIMDSIARYSCAGGGIVAGVQGCITNNPLFTDRANGDYRLAHYSPCINAGLNGYALTNGPGGSTIDLAGTSRVIHVTVDIGAYEYNGIPGTPGILPAGSTNAHGFLARWSYPVGGAPFYTNRLMVTNQTSGGTALVYIAAAAATNYLTTGLVPGKRYGYTVRTENEFGASDWSAWMTVTTLTEGAINISTSVVAFSAVYGSTNPAAKYYALSNAGQTAFAWTSSVAYIGSSGWLSIQPSNGTLNPFVSSNIAAVASMGSLDAGSYVATNATSSGTATNSPQRRRFTLTIARGLDTIIFAGTNQVYDGLPKTVIALATSGSAVITNYAGSLTPPTEAGIYAVTAIVNSLNWVATNTTVLTIAKGSQAIAQFLPASGSQASTSTVPITANGGGSGNPVVFAVESGPGILLPGDNLRFTGYGTVCVSASQAGDANWLAAPTLTNLYTVAPVPVLTHYVAQAGQTPVWPFAGWAGAASNIQDAVDAAWDSDRVKVGQGIYSSGGRIAPGFVLSNRVYITRSVVVESEDGPGSTFIKGQAGAGGTFGAGAVRCAYLTNGAVLSGFTLTNGWTRNDGDLLRDRSGGGALVLNGGTVVRCRIQGNQALEYGGGVFVESGGELDTCIVASNGAQRGGGIYMFRGGGAYNCTVVTNIASISGGGAYLVDGGNLRNTIAWYNAAGISGANILQSGVGPVVDHACAPDGVTHGAAGCITNEPAFANLALGNYHLQSGSACVDAGDNAAARSTIDYDGEPRIVGTVDMGADEYLAVPAPPTVLPATGRTTGGFTANWMAGNEMTVTNYVLAVDIMPAATTIFSNAVGAATNYPVSGLAPGCVYRYHVYGENECGKGVWSIWMSVTTLTEAAIGVPSPVAFNAIYASNNPPAQVVALNNAGQVGCVWSNALTYGGGASGWLTATPAAGDLPAGASSNLALSVNIGGLSAGIYQATNTISSPTATNSPQQLVVTLVITQRNLYVKCDDKARLYGETNPVFTLQITNYAAGEGAANLTIVPVADCSATVYSPTGIFAIAASGGAATNYQFSYAAGALTITQRTLYVTCDDKARIYGDTNPVFTLQITNYAAGEGAANLTVVPAADCSATVYSPTGIFAIAASGGAATNYLFVYADGALTITQRILYVACDDKARGYAETNPVFTLQITNYAAGEGAANLTVVPVAASVATVYSPTGIYAITASGGLATNYQFSYTAGALAITQRILYVKCDDKARGYGETNPVFTVTITNYATGEGAANLAAVPVATCDATTFSPTGSYAITASGGMATNYQFVYAGGVLVVGNGDQTISFANPGDQWLRKRVVLSGWATSGLRVRFVVVSGPAVIAGSNMTFTATGMVTIAARQPGDSQWNAAPPVRATFEVYYRAKNDYDGDGRSDLPLYNKLNGRWYVVSATGTSIVWNVAWTGTNRFPLAGDYDGDEIDDLCVLDPVTGRWNIRAPGGAVILADKQWGGAGIKPVTGDYDGDGRYDLVVYSESAGAWYGIGVDNKLLFWNRAWGGVGMHAVPGDYDGDGIWDFAVFNDSIGKWYIQSSGGALIAWNVSWGSDGMTPVPGDYDGDGIDDLALYDQPSGKWYIRAVSGTIIAWGASLGGNGFAPVPGDYDGDGISDLAVYVEATGKWYGWSLGKGVIFWNLSWGGRGLTPVNW